MVRRTESFDRARRVYAALPRAYPAEVTDDVGAELMETFLDRYRSARATGGRQGMRPGTGPERGLTRVASVVKSH